MKRHFATLLSLVSLFVLPASAMAQSSVTKGITRAYGEDGFDKLKDGECGYIVGCSLAASMGIPACGELPSGKQFQKDQNSADMSAAIAAVQKKQAEAADISAACSKALQNLQQQDSPDSADTSAAIAILQKIKQAADNVVATTPDVFTIGQPYIDKSAADEKIPAYTFPQRVMAWGVEHIPASETQNTRPAVTSTDNSADDDAASSEEEDNQVDVPKNGNPFAAAQEILQQNMQQLNDQAQQAAKNRIPIPAEVQPSRGPQLKQGKQNSSGCTVGDGITTKCP